MGIRTSHKFLFSTALVLLVASALMFSGREQRQTRAAAATVGDSSRKSGSADGMGRLEDSSVRESAALPSEGTPWRVSKSKLFVRALRGDKIAAERLFRDTQICAETLSLQNELDSLASAEARATPQEKSPESERMMQQIRGMLSGVENMCTESDKAELARDVDQILLAAAGAGNKTAAACYLNARFHDIVRTWPEAEYERYTQLAPQFAEAAVKQGNWSVVSFLGFVYAPSKGFGIAAQVFGVDRVKEYAYVKLQELGATGELKAGKAERLTYLRESGTVSEGDVQQADAWAQSTFEKYFHEPLETDQPPACTEPASATVNE